ncbi:hypothetical protein ACX8XP_13090 [Calditrichota bacterium LG25]
MASVNTKIIYLFVILINLKFSFSQYIIDKLMIPIGNSDDKICDSSNFDSGISTLHFCIDEDKNFFIYDYADLSIKKFSFDGKYLGKINLPFSTSVKINYYKQNIFTGNFFKNDNKLYIYDAISMKLKRKPIQLFNANDVWDYEQYDSLLIFNLPYEKYNVYDMKNDKIYTSLDNPFIKTNFSKNEQLFLNKYVLKNYDVCYLGKVSDYLVLIKYSIVKDEYIVGLFNLKESQKREAKFSIGRGRKLNPILHRTSYLVKKRYLIFLGYERKNKKFKADEFITINVLDLKLMFPDIPFPDIKF